MMRRSLIKAAGAVFLLILVFVMAGCGAKNKENEQKESYQVAGGWTKVDDGTVTPELKEMFDSATSQLTGVEYTPVELLETQIVSGLNYKFLCTGKAVVPDAQEKKFYVYIYKNLDGEAVVTEIEELK